MFDIDGLLEDAIDVALVAAENGCVVLALDEQDDRHAHQLAVFLKRLEELDLPLAALLQVADHQIRAHGLRGGQRFLSIRRNADRVFAGLQVSLDGGRKCRVIADQDQMRHGATVCEMRVRAASAALTDAADIDERDIVFGAMLDVGQFTDRGNQRFARRCGLDCACHTFAVELFAVVHVQLDDAV